MNHYGVTAKRHWERWLPARYAAIQDPDSFFSTLGEEVAYRIADLTLDLAGDDPPEEDYLIKVGRLNMARLQAEEIVLREQVLLSPEPEADPETVTQDEQVPGSHWETSMVVDRSHPMWEEVNAEQQELAGS